MALESSRSIQMQGNRKDKTVKDMNSQLGAMKDQLQISEREYRALKKEYDEMRRAHDQVMPQFDKAQAKKLALKQELQKKMNLL